MTFEEWFSNRELYHWIGYLITNGENIQEIKNESIDKTKSEFKDYLKEKIRIIVNYDEVIKLNYEKHKKAIEKILLLFNIETILRNNKENSRYPFYKHKKEEWSLEHIHAQNSKGLNSDESRIAWLKEIVNSLSNLGEINNKNEKNKEFTNIFVKINKIIKRESIKKDEFDILQAEIFNLFGNPHLNSLENLTLLSLKDNISVSNSIFPVKRKGIIELEKEGSFIPICTRNVFLKYYTKNASHLYYWGEGDQKDYFNAILEKLENYLPKQKEANGSN